MNKRASIDIGSNTTLLLVAKVVDGNVEEIEAGEKVTALGRGLDRTKKIHPQSMQDTFDALKGYQKIIEKHGLDVGETIVTATEAARVAINAKTFFQEIYETLGFRIHVITAEGEAYYTLRGVVQDNADTSVMVDIGGASTELIKFSEGLLERMISLPAGSVRGTDWRERGCFGERMEDIFSKEQSEIALFQSSHLVGVGGTLTSLVALSKNSKNFDRRGVEGRVLEQDELAKCVERIERLSEEQLGESFPFLGKRVKSIKAGSRLAFMVGELLGCQSWKISTCGLRHGVLREGRIDERFKL